MLPLLLLVPLGKRCHLIARMKEAARSCEELKHEIWSERNCRDSFERELRKELHYSLNYMNQQCEEAMERLKTVSEENRSIKKNNEQLLARCSELAERDHAQEMGIVKYEQCSCKNNIEIESIPTVVNENLLSVLGK